jgi:putative chitinase
MLESQLLALGIEGKWLEPLLETFEKYDISTPKRQAYFIGQCMHESGGFKQLKENLNYSAKGLMATGLVVFLTQIPQKSMSVT